MSADQRPRSLPDRVLGAAGVAMILLAGYLLLFGGPGDSGGSDPAMPPSVELLAPIDGAAVRSPVEVRFTVDRPIAPLPGGWGVDGFHLHAQIDGREVMPGPGDLRRLDGGRYEWTLPPLAPGEHHVTLSWSDALHRPLPNTQLPGARVTVEPLLP